MMVMENTIEYIQDLVGDNWTVKFENERLLLTAEGITEGRLDSQQLTRIQSMGFDFETVLVTGPITDIIIAPNGGVRG